MRDINLLPEDSMTPEMPKQAVKQFVSVKTVIIAAAVVIFAAASLLFPGIYVKTLNARLDSIREKLNSRTYEEVRTVNKQLDDVNNSINSKINILKDIDTKGCSANAVLNTIMQCLPGGCSIKEIGVNSDLVTVSGEAPNGLTAAEFLLNVERLGFFETSDNLGNFSEPNNNAKYNFEYTFTMNGKGGK